MATTTMYTAKQVAEMLDMSERWIRKKTAEGEIGCYRLGSRDRKSVV